MKDNMSPFTDPQPIGPVQCGFLGREWSDTGRRYGTHPVKVLLRRAAYMAGPGFPPVPVAHALQWVPNGSQYPVHQQVNVSRR